MNIIQKTNNKFSIFLFSAMLALMLPLVSAAQGKIAFSSNRDGNYEIYKMNPDGTNQVNLSNNAAFDFEPSFNRYGSRLAFTSFRDLNLEIYAMNADGTNQTRLTNNPASDFEPAFSPNGSKVAFVSDRNGNYEIYVMNADGTGQIRLTFNATVDRNPVFSPDGSKIAFVSYRDGNYEIYSMNSDGTNQVNLTNEPTSDVDPSFSPVGGKIAFASNRDGGLEIYKMNTNGSNVERLTFNDSYDAQPSFSPDGNSIAYTSDFYGTYPATEILTMDADGGNQTRATFAGFNWEINNTPSWSSKPRDFSLLTLSDLISPDSEPNRAVAGSYVALDFRLEGFRGGNVYSSAPTSQQVNCSNNLPLGSAEPINRTQPDVVYFTGLEYYSTTWITQSNWRGTCRMVNLNLADGSVRPIKFQF